jgi:maleate cis-trans isomerase
MLATRSEILAHLRTLRANIAMARAALMNYKDDRLDRDKLEPAARRVDDLMDMYAGRSGSVPRGLGWIAEIQSGIEAVTNAKAAGALSDAQAVVTALRAAMGVADASGCPI